MPKQVELYVGQRLDGMFCVYCGFRTSATVWRETFRWLIRLDCGHDKNLGTTLPLEELEARGLINEDTIGRDPRAIIAEQNAARKQMEENYDIICRVLSEAECFMDEEFMYHVNPFHRMLKWQIESYKKTKTGQEELKRVWHGIMRWVDYNAKAEFNAKYAKSHERLRHDQARQHRQDQQGKDAGTSKVTTSGGDILDS